MKSRASVVRSRARLIRVNVYDFNIILFRAFLANADLRLDALFVLSVRTETRVDNSRIHSFSSEKRFIFSENELSGKGGTVKEQVENIAV